MECVIFSGLQGSGKSSFYIEQFFSSHVRISLDLLRTRNRENRLLELCLGTQQRFVIDNTNPTAQEREKYIRKATQDQFRIIGYYFSSRIEECLNRNARRSLSVPDVAILSTAKKLAIPSFDEGFDELWYVKIKGRKFCREEWKDEV